jgi:hypothetical protein
LAEKTRSPVLVPRPLVSELPVIQEQGKNFVSAASAAKNTRIWFYSAAQLHSAPHDARESRVTRGNYGILLDGDAGYDNGLNRRTAPGTAHADKARSQRGMSSLEVACW